jgi:Coenzyme PQQ synthesis protein D (PqqD)
MEKYLLENGIIDQKVDDGFLLLKEDGEYVILNRIAGKIVEYTKSIHNIDDISEKLSHIKGSPSIDKCKKQVIDLLQELLKQGFMRVEGE